MNEKKLDEIELMQKKKKDIIKNVAIVFLIVMLLLTFFSNTIMNYSLPEVSTAYAQSGSVTSKVRGTGVVEAAEDYEVKVTENRVVSSVKVKVGDIVEADQLLFVLESGATGDETVIKEAQEALDAMELEYNKALLNAAPSYALDNLEIKSAREDLQEAINNQARAASKSTLSAQVIETQKKIEKLQVDIDSLQAKTETVSGNSLQKVNRKLSEKKKQLADLNASLATAQATLETLPSVEEAKAAVKERQRALDTLLLTLADKQTTDKVTTGQASLDLKAQKKKMEDQRALVEKLTTGDGTETEITAKNAGVVKSVNCIAGDTVTADSPLATIAVTGNGYSCSFSVTKEQSKLVRKDQQAEILNLWGTDMEVTLTDIKPDLDNPNQNMILKFSVKGEDVTVGETLTLSVGEKTAPYDVVVPNSAIREDNNGKFVLVVTVKSSPLGNRYVLSRADVEILASDDQNSAVSGGLFGYEYVVTNATKPLESGMKVRLAE